MKKIMFYVIALITVLTSMTSCMCYVPATTSPYYEAVARRELHAAKQRVDAYRFELEQEAILAKQRAEALRRYGY